MFPHSHSINNFQKNVLRFFRIWVGNLAYIFKDSQHCNVLKLKRCNLGRCTYIHQGYHQSRGAWKWSREKKRREENKKELPLSLEWHKCGSSHSTKPFHPIFLSLYLDLILWIFLMYTKLYTRAVCPSSYMLMCWFDYVWMLCDKQVYVLSNSIYVGYLFRNLPLLEHVI
jgi:hypothetical protein